MDVVEGERRAKRRGAFQRGEIGRTNGDSSGWVVTVTDRDTEGDYAHWQGSNVNLSPTLT